MAKREWLGVAAILVLAAALRFWGIGHDVWIDENKVVNPSIAMAQSEGLPFLTPPRSYYPHFTHHILALVFWPIAKMAPDFPNEQYHVVARVVAALFNIATVGVVYMIGRRLLRHWGGIVAALFLAVMPLHVKYSHFIQVDIVATFFMTLALWSALKIWDEGEAKWYILTGIFVGAAGASQFWGLTAGAALVLTHAKRAWQERWNLNRIFRPALLLGLVLILATFTALSPHLIFMWDEQYRESFTIIQMRGASGALGYISPNILWPFYTTSPDWSLSFTSAGLMWETGWLLVGLTLLGMGLVWRQRDWRVLVLLGGVMIIWYLAIAGVVRMHAVKRLLPVTVPMVLLASYGVISLYRYGWRLPVSLLVGVTILWSLVQGVRFDAAYAGGSTHKRAVAWAEENIPRGSIVLQHGPLKLLEPNSEEWKIVRMNEVYSNFNPDDPEVAKDRAKYLDAWIREEGVQYVALDSIMVDRYWDPTSMKLYPETTASYRTYYDDVRSRGKLIYLIKPELGKQAGPRVEIYDVRGL